MVFRRDSKVDAFQRQLSALRNQLGGAEEDDVRHEPHLPVVLRDDFDYPPDRSRDAPSRGSSFLAPRDGADRREFDVAGSSLPDIPAIDELTSVLSHTTTWNGHLDSTGSLHIHGRVEGALSAGDSIFIAEEAVVDAEVRAANVTIAGSVRGSVHCTDRFEVLPQGRVAAGIRAPVVVIHEGALVTGDIAMTGALDADRSLRAPARAAQAGG